jgi:hypothetical protein
VASVGADLEESVRACVGYDLLSCQGEDAIGIRIFLVSRRVVVRFGLAEIAQQSPLAVRRGASEAGKLRAVGPEHRLARAGIPAEADREEEIASSLQ